MCKIFSYIFCCGCCKKRILSSLPSETVIKPKKKHRKSRSSAKYGTDWETNVNQIKNMTPSEIEDSLITKQIEIDEKLFQNRIELYKAVGVKWGFQFVTEVPIGKGGYGEVYKIKETKTQTTYALKVMRLRSANDAFSASRFNTFKCEIFSLRKSCHKNIINLFDHFMVKEWLSFMVMEFATGGDLKKRLKARYQSTGKPFAENESKNYFAQISNAMHFVHSIGLIHGDLKLENVLITIDSTGKEVIKVTDFGCARVSYKDESGVVLREKAVGTVICMAPEQIRVFICVNLGKPELLRREVITYNPFRADVWSLGVCLYRMLFWDYPFVYDTKNMTQTLPKMLTAMKRGFEAPKDIAQNLSAESMDLLKSLLEYNKNNRIDMKIVMSHKWVINCPELDKIEPQ